MTEAFYIFMFGVILLIVDATNRFLGKIDWNRREQARLSKEHAEGIRMEVLDDLLNDGKITYADMISYVPRKER